MGAMIIGAHSIIYSTAPDADRAFLRDVLALGSVDVGGGWLIFGLPPAELAVHPSDTNDKHELYLMCDDVEAFMLSMGESNIACGPVQDLGWGRLTEVILPGGGKLGVYQPRHARPEPAKKAAKPGAKKAAKPAAKKAAMATPAAKKKPASRATKEPAPAKKPAKKPARSASAAVKKKGQSKKRK
jgi:hypothetical protein